MYSSISRHLPSATFLVSYKKLQIERKVAQKEKINLRNTPKEYIECRGRISSKHGHGALLARVGKGLFVEPRPSRNMEAELSLE